MPYYDELVKDLATKAYNHTITAAATILGMSTQKSEAPMATNRRVSSMSEWLIPKDRFSLTRESLSTRPVCASAMRTPDPYARPKRMPAIHMKDAFFGRPCMKVSGLKSVITGSKALK